MTLLGSCNVPSGKKDEIRERLEKMWNYEKFTSPYKKGEYTSLLPIARKNMPAKIRF